MQAKPDHNDILNPPTGLVSFFLFNSQASDKEYDVFGNNDGVVSGGSWESNDQGLTYLLEDEDYINFGGTEWSISDEFTIFMRLCLRSNVAGVDYDSIIQRGRYFFPFAVRLTTGNNLNFATRTTAMNYLNNTISLSLNKWYDLCLTRDNNGVKNIYIDGVNDGTDTQAGDLDFGSGQETILGKDYDAGVLYSDIEIACLIMFNKALTEGQVKYFDPFEMFYGDSFGGYKTIGGFVDFSSILSSISNSTANLTRLSALSAEIVSTSGFISTLQRLRSLQGSLDSVSEIDALITRIKNIDSSIASISDFQSELGRTRSFTSNIESVSSVSGLLNAIYSLSSSILSISRLIGELTTSEFTDFVATIASTSNLDALLGKVTSFVSSINNISALVGNITQIHSLSAYINTSSELIASLNKIMRLLANLDSTSDLIGNLRWIKSFQADIVSVTNSIGNFIVSTGDILIELFEFDSKITMEAEFDSKITMEAEFDSEVKLIKI